jgi:ATP-dependent Clp protease ATP-binding subunit ClpC
MNGYNFTERVRKVLAMAREEAARLHHEYVGTEHILLGLIREGEGVAAAVLQNLSIELDDIQQKTEQMVKGGRAGQTIGPDLPYTSRAKKVLELAMGEARSLNHAYVGTEHLLLGLMREKQGVAAQTIASFGITIDMAREEVLRILGTAMPKASATGWTAGRLSFPIAGPTSMAASVIEALMHDAGVAEVFAAQGIDPKRLLAALRAAAFRAPPSDPPGSSASDSPPVSPPAA